MSKRDRKQKKKKERQERLRKEKHLRQSSSDQADEVVDDEGNVVGEGLFFSGLPSPFATERMLHELHGGSGDAREQAQDIAYQALETDDAEETVRLARRLTARPAT